jgi:hypothetical protein
MKTYERAAMLDVYDVLRAKADATQRAANAAEREHDDEVRNHLIPESRMWSSLADAVRRAITHDTAYPVVKAFVDDEYTAFAEWCESRGVNHTDV